MEARHLLVPANSCCWSLLQSRLQLVVRTHQPGSSLGGPYVKPCLQPWSTTSPTRQPAVSVQLGTAVGCLALMCCCVECLEVHAAACCMHSAPVHMLRGWCISVCVHNNHTTHTTQQLSLRMHLISLDLKAVIEDSCFL